MHTLSNSQEREKEANELKAAIATTSEYPRGEECTIRTNSQQLYSNGGGSSISDDMCGKCSKNSREALQRAGQQQQQQDQGKASLMSQTRIVVFQLQKVYVFVIY